MGSLLEAWRCATADFMPQSRYLQGLRYWPGGDGQPQQEKQDKSSNTIDLTCNCDMLQLLGLLLLPATRRRRRHHLSWSTLHSSVGLCTDAACHHDDDNLRL